MGAISGDEGYMGQQVVPLALWNASLAYLNGGGNFKTSIESRDDEHIRGGAMGGHSLDTSGHCSNLLGLPSSAVSLGFRNFVLEPYWTLSSVLASMTIKDPTESIVS